MRDQRVEIDSHCTNYAANACPMVSGRLTYYRTTPVRLDTTMVPSPDSPARQGAPAEPWFAVWLRAYQVINDHDDLAGHRSGRSSRKRPAPD